MEYVSQSANTVWGTAHYAVNGQHQSSQGTLNLSSPVPSGYHVYAIEWTDKRIEWFVDDKSYFNWDYSQRTPPVDGNAFNGKFFFILNYAIGGAWPEAPDSSQYPGQMRVDWVRVWQ
jgi:beta-glucanase (GH16 family)